MIEKPRLWFARIAVLLAVGLTIATLLAHWRQPDLPSLPGKGCLVTSFQSPDSTRIPAAHIEFESCLHISETIYNLSYYGAADEGGSVLFTATGPEGPDRWNQHLQIRWPTRDTLFIVVDPEVRVESVVKRAHGVQVILQRTGDQ